MAKVLFTAIVADMRNKLAGTVFSKNRYGAYTRTKVTPVNRRTEAQQLQRQQFGSLSASYRQLTAEQIAAWNAAAKQFTRTDVFGNQRNLTGQTLYVGLNRNLMNIGQPTSDAAPSPKGVPEFIVDGVSWLVGVSTFDRAEIVLTSPLDNQFTLLVYATAPQSAGKRYMSNYKLLSPGVPLVPSGTPAVTYDALSAYQAEFGIPAAGAVIGYRLVAVNKMTGEASAPMEGLIFVQQA